jgi:hypothetical protein
MLMTRILTKARPGEPVQVVPAPQSLFSTTARFWVETIALASVITCFLALVIASLGAVAGAAAEEPESGQPVPSSTGQAYEGVITDTHCGAKHSAAIGRTAADCTLGCVRGGEQFVLVDGDTTYLLEGNATALKRVAGQRVRIFGTLNGRKISVTSIVTT